MDEIPWWDALTKTNRDLKIDDPMRYRLERLNQPLPISTAWAPMVGLWGGQKTAAEVSKIVGKNTRSVRSYAQAQGLRLATRFNPARPQAAVALEVHQTQSEGCSSKEAAEQVGVLPVEALYYFRAVEALCELIEEPPESLAEHTDDELQQLWLQGGFRLYYPRTPDEQATFPSEAAELLADPVQ